MYKYLNFQAIPHSSTRMIITIEYFEILSIYLCSFHTKYACILKYIDLTPQVEYFVSQSMYLSIQIRQTQYGLIQDTSHHILEPNRTLITRQGTPKFSAQMFHAHHKRYGWVRDFCSVKRTLPRELTTTHTQCVVTPTNLSPLSPNFLVKLRAGSLNDL